VNELDQFISLSKYAGERFDMIQAGGGNTSVKISDKKMIIKASGCTLSSINKNFGYVEVNQKIILNMLSDDNFKKILIKKEREEKGSDIVKLSQKDKNKRASIETTLHSLTYKYTLHTHPIAVNMICNQREWKKVLERIFSQKDIMMVNYKTPGVDLALEIGKKILEKKNTPKIIFLQNHGLIIHSDNYQEVFQLNELVLSKLEKFLGLNFDRYKMTNFISSEINQAFNSELVSYLVEDSFLTTQLQKNKELFFKYPFCPDSFVFCGESALEISKNTVSKDIASYKNRFIEHPKVIIFDNLLFLLGADIPKIRMVEDVLKFNIMILKNNNKYVALKKDEISYLSNWEAEAFRKNLKN
jgi:rhamnose utilization protein RhaD (predicted bifunctional aldolase and dehydrogenase)|tara:strand:- start:5367 stop:6437 length:1071 start_codon:yes stop_codon:yes gene_type:complete